MKKASALQVFGGVVNRMKSLGLKGTILQLMRTNIIRVGRLAGTDEFGNNYYEAVPSDTIAERRRWVESPRLDFDPSEVPPHWHAWLHCQSDVVPSGKETDYLYRRPHVPNLTGTSLAYKPGGYQFQKHAKPIRAYSGVEGITAESLNQELENRAENKQ